jgi:hypothetical protein
MKYLYYKREVNSYTAHGYIPINKILYVEGSSNGERTHVTLVNGEILTIDFPIRDVLVRLDSMG